MLMRAGGRIAAGRGTLQDYAAVAGKGSKLASTLLCSSTRLAPVRKQSSKIRVPKRLLKTLLLAPVLLVVLRCRYWCPCTDKQVTLAKPLLKVLNLRRHNLLQSLLGGAAHGIGTLVNKVQGPPVLLLRSKDPAVIEKTLNELSPGLMKLHAKSCLKNYHRLKIRGLSNQFSKTFHDHKKKFLSPRLLNAV